MTRHAVTVPQVYDPWVRTARTVLTLVVAFPSFAPVALALLAVVHAPDGSNIALWVGTLVGWVTLASGAITRLLAVPAVNDWLARFRLAGHSGDLTALDSPTRAIALPVLADAH